MDAIETQTELFVYVIQAVISHQNAEASANSGVIVGVADRAEAPGPSGSSHRCGSSYTKPRSLF